MASGRRYSSSQYINWLDILRWESWSGGLCSCKICTNCSNQKLNIEGLSHGVHTKIIHPGFIDTPMFDGMKKNYFEQNLRPLIGLQRKIQPEEISDIVCSMIEIRVISGEIWADASLIPLA